MFRATASSLSARAVRTLLRLLAALLTLTASTAFAQVSSQYTNSTSGAINDLTCSAGSELTRTFTVGSNVTITDVNIGVALLHTYRQDLIITLTSPQGTTITLMTAVPNDGDNLSDLFDDSAFQPIANHAVSSSDSTAAVPPYSHSFRPSAALSAFNGQRSAGTWTLKICDNVAVDTGSFTRSDLYITGTTLNDLSLAMTSSTAAPVYGTNFTYTLTVSSDATSSATATGVNVTDLLPAGSTFVSATGTGTYTSGTGVWSVGSMAAGGSASLTITATANGPVASTVANIAQITASSQPDPDSTVNNSVTTEDDYASRAITVGANTINCPTGTTATGSGYAASGSSSYVGQIFWLDWSCGSTTLFNKGATINKSWTVADGLAITGQITSLTDDVRPYTVGTWSGDRLNQLHSGLNPIGLRNYVDGVDPQFTLSLSATLNAQPVALRYVLGDGEDSDGASSSESISATTTGSAWQNVETSGSITVNSAGASTLIYDPAAAGGGTAVLESSATSISFAVTLTSAGGTAAAFGIFTPYDFSDAPLTGTTYGSANHRTISGLRMGGAVTSELTAYDSPTASADADDGITLPPLFRSQAATISVPVTGPGKLSSWLDYNADGDFADAGEQIASSVSDGGVGDSDGTANGMIIIALTPPATASTNPTIARFRFSSNSGAASSGLAGFGEVEDYQLSVIRPSLAVTKVSTVLTDPANGAANPKLIPGASVQYCVSITNDGSASASSIALSDTLSGNVSFVTGSMKSGTSCAGAASTEDDNSTGTDETDPYGAAISGTTISGSAATLSVGSSFVLTYTVIIN
jgi:uncharacterized repeat protein (TIGR01451 family)